MKPTWKSLIAALAAHGYDGEANDLDAVSKYIADNCGGIVRLKGEVVDVKAMHADEFEAKALSLDDAVAQTAQQTMIDDAVLAVVDATCLKAKRANAGDGDAKPGDVKVIKDCLEDDPCLGYPDYENYGFAHVLYDIAKATLAIKGGAHTDVPERLTKMHAIVAKDGQGMNIENPSEGGFLVPVEHRNELLRKAHETAMLVGRCRQLPMGSKSVEIPYIKESSRVAGSRHGGVRGYWGAEGGTLTGSQAKFGKVTLNAHKLHTLGYATDEFLEDSPISLAFLADLFFEELGFLMDEAIVNGTGSGQPLGILNAPALKSVAKESSQTATTINPTNIIKMWSAMWARSRPNAVWLINQDIEPELMTLILAGTNSDFLMYSPMNRLADSPFATLLGRPVLPIEQASTLGTKGDIMLVDLSQYIWATRGGLKQNTSMHVAFVTDEMAFKVTTRVDGQPWWSSPLTPYKGSNTVSPFISLDTRA